MKPRFNSLTIRVFVIIIFLPSLGCRPKNQQAASSPSDGAFFSKGPIDSDTTPLPVWEGGIDVGTKALIEADEMASRGDVGGAERTYLELLSRDPSNEEIHFNLAFLYGKIGRTNDAIAQYREAIRLLPNYAEARGNLGNLLVKARRYSEAIEELTAAVSAEPLNSRAYNNLGTALAASGQSVRAIPYFARAVQLNPDFPEAWFNLGCSQIAIGHLDDGIVALRTAVTLDPRLMPARKQLNRALDLKRERGY